MSMKPFAVYTQKRVCQRCKEHKHIKGGTMKGGFAGFFVCADCKAKKAA